MNLLTNDQELIFQTPNTPLLHNINSLPMFDLTDDFGQNVSMQDSNDLNLHGHSLSSPGNFQVFPSPMMSDLGIDCNSPIMDTQMDLELMSMLANMSKSDTLQNSKPLICICGKSFKTTQTLKAHAKMHIFPHKIHNCNTCNRKFSRKHDLKRHEQTHMREKPFQCDHCNVQFSRLDALYRHVKGKRCKNL
jgi:uncharacterized Zn-finger protein